MAEQTVRQLARRTAYDTRTRLRAERAARDRALEECAATVLVELATRDATIARCEAAAGRALDQMVTVHGLSVTAAGVWAGGLTAREVARLRRAAHPSSRDANDNATDGVSEDGAVVAAEPTAPDPTVTPPVSTATGIQR